MLLRRAAAPLLRRRGLSAAATAAAAEPTSPLSADALEPPGAGTASPPPAAGGPPLLYQVRACHIARRIDIVQLFQSMYTQRQRVSQSLNKDCVVIRLEGGGDAAAADPVRPPTIAGASGAGTGAASPAAAAVDARTRALLGGVLPTGDAVPADDKYVVFYDHGAVVFFNCDHIVVNSLKRYASPFCTDFFTMQRLEEEYQVRVNPRLEERSRFEDSHLAVKQLSERSVRVIAGVLGQTVALEYYETQVEGILEEFQTLNNGLQGGGILETGLLGIRERQQRRSLFRTVATNNAILTDVITKLRLLDRKRPGDTEWKFAHYHRIWEGLREEFELEERFAILDKKLDIIQLNTKFFLEVMGTQKGERLEWYIIFLISAELGLGMYDLARSSGWLSF